MWLLCDRSTITVWQPKRINQLVPSISAVFRVELDVSAASDENLIIYKYQLKRFLTRGVLNVAGRIFLEHPISLKVLFTSGNE